ncbi:hypothetical protein H8A97_42440 [Bradyrhizobium sp. Arg62]|nr:hypothetical protein [Bradyrhizobium brasilense]
MDLFSRKIVGWTMRGHMQVELVAVRPDHGDPPAASGGWIDPSLRSRRAQYASRDYRAALSPESSDQ